VSFYYFGCWGREAGHYLRSADGAYGLADRRRVADIVYTNPWKTNIDGGLCPGSRKQGDALLHHKDGWTAVAYWDNSVDERPGSNSVFLSDQNLGFNEMIELAEKYFPEVFARASFEVRWTS
jgi:hypothetical protein